MSGTFGKDPNGVDYYWQDFADWLEDGDTIVSATWTVIRGDVVKGATSIEGSRAIVWLSAGTPGTSADLTVHVTTTSGRQTDETITIILAER